MIIPAIDPNLQGWIQTLAWIGTFCGIIVAIFNYVSQQKQNRRQRERELEQSKSELRWKQAEAAKKILDEMLSSSGAKAAMQMLDWNDVEFEIASGKREVIWEKDYIKALRTNDLQFSDKEVFIRNSFDSLFYYMAMMEHYIKSDLVLLEDVSFPLDYYLKIMNSNKVVFENFLMHYEQDKTVSFIERLKNNNPKLLKNSGKSS